jgi:hypothetical protein
LKLPLGDDDIDDDDDNNNNNDINVKFSQLMP